jgi:transcriptional regulator with XRE-family HTH domain
VGLVQDRIPDATINRAVGEEIRRARQIAKLTRSDLVKRMGSGIKVQTLGGYERGIRQCAIARLVEICRALGVAAPEVLRLALQRVEIDLHTIGLQVDLRAVVRDRRSELVPLRRWARNRLADDPDGSGVVHLGPAVVQEMGAMLGYSRADLINYLMSFIPASVP